MQTDLITKVYFNEHLTHSCVGIPQGLQALLSSLNQYKTLTKNFNQGLNSGELVCKMAKSKHQKQH